ncbi:hypothetical protein DFJ73DRAFT_265749 [Zopfochytrium polystomum]|nr:hypothetical protein DFJ73DRAFT_265749 [Zopfochytrium polystomum]
MNLDHITAELDEFESFVEEYTSKMNDILKGNAVDIAGAPVQADPKPFVAVSAERATSRLDDESPISVSDSSDQKVAALERTALGPSLRSPPPGGKPQPKKAPSIPRSVQKPGIIDYSHFESISLDDGRRRRQTRRRGRDRRSAGRADGRACRRARHERAAPATSAGGPTRGGGGGGSGEARGGAARGTPRGCGRPATRSSGRETGPRRRRSTRRRSTRCSGRRCSAGCCVVYEQGGREDAIGRL